MKTALPPAPAAVPSTLDGVPLPESPAPRLAPARLWAIGLVLALLGAVALLAGQHNPYLGDYGDDAELLILGQGLATGQGYAWVNTPDAPAHNRYPPGYPALVAVAMVASGTAASAAQAIVPAKLVTMGTLFGAAALLWPLARRRLGAPWAAGAVAIFVLNPFVLRFAGEVMSDVPYVLALLAALAWADYLRGIKRIASLGGSAPHSPRETARVGVQGAQPFAQMAQRDSQPPGGAGGSFPHPGSAGVQGALPPARRRQQDLQGPPPPGGRGGWANLLGWAGLGALLALGAYVRTVGLAAGVGALAWAWCYCWSERGRERGQSAWAPWAPALVATGTFLLLLLPWWVRDATLAGGWRYLEELLAAQYSAPGAGTVSSTDLIGRAVGNVGFLVGKPGVFGAAGMVAGVAGAAVVLTGYWTCLRQGGRPGEYPEAGGGRGGGAIGGAAEWVAVALVVAVLFWPIRTGRYLLPVIPLLGIYAIAGALVIGVAISRLRPALRLRPWVSGVVAAGIVGFILLEGLYAGREALQNRRALALGGGAAGYYAGRPEWGRYLDAAAWLGEHAGEGDVALGKRHFLLYVMSGRYADKYRFETTPEELDYLFSGTRRKLLVEDAFSELRGDFAPLLPAVRAQGGDLRLRYETGAPAVRVWELVRPGETPSGAPGTSPGRAP